MSSSRTLRIRKGGSQGIVAIFVAVSVGATIGVSTWSTDVIAGRLAIFGVLLFIAALGIGSARVVGAASLPVLGSALIASATADTTSWTQSIVVGVGWYVAVELAWDSIERRGGTQRSNELDLRRIQEVSSVVMLSLAMTVTAFVISGIGIERSLVTQVLVIGSVIAALVIALSHVISTSPQFD